MEKRKKPQTAVSHSCAHELSVRSRFGSGDLELRILATRQDGVGSKPFIGPDSPWTWAVPRGNGFHAFRHANATLMSSFGASQKLRQQRLGHADGSPVTETIYTHVISEDGKRIAAQLGSAVWGILDASWTEKENGSRVESPKPFVIN